jgi:hypothetical protein
MPRFRSTTTGVVVSVSEANADRYRTGWESLEATTSGDSSAGGYEAMTVEQLKDEIRTRNEDRDDEDRLPLTGTKAELVAALGADDE